MSTVVSTEKASVLVILRREYLDITGNFCAAKLIEYFRHWTKWKLKNHRTPWVYQPLKRIYADLMGEHSLHVIRSAIALLESMGLIEKQKNPGNGQDKTWQYKLHVDVLDKLLEHGKCKTEHSRFNAEQYHRSHPETSKPQQNTAVGEVKDEGVKQSQYEPVRQAPEPEQPQITHFVDELELDDSTGEIDPHDDEFSEAQVEVVSNTDKPSKHEIAEICTELRRLRINPEPCLGVVKKYWVNVQGAIARVKEGIYEGWCDNPTGLFINSCKSGAKGKNTVTSDVSTWFEWAKKQRIVLAMSSGVVFTPDGDAIEIGEMMRLHPLTVT
ncbi:ELKS/Rab6-interacting/CAST family protein [Tolypothrix sp. PCC 7910]|uniref:ELKS/Rab6-interacting/CAST family protein n=1 Tax=Tolypothrix sp. PCC 7910 TaxID=2099387 RepID=UPI001FCAE800|nr:ELKS/Rab6-interacting/CAST family protein [Tolypothrix sp. PCC 7910]